MNLHEDHPHALSPRQLRRRLHLEEHRPRRPSLPEQRADARLALAAVVLYVLTWLLALEAVLS